MKRRQYLKVAPASVVPAAILAGCSGQSDDDGEDSSGDGQDTTGEQTDSSSDGNSSSGQTFELWHDKGQNPNWNPIFEAATPVLNDIIEEDVTVEVVPYQSTDGYQGAIRPVLGTEDGPGAFTWWAGQRLENLAQQDYAYDITDVWDEHIEAGEYPESIKNVFSVDGKAYGIPNQVSYWTLWYKRSKFEELGVEPPETWEEFRTLTQTIQDESGGDTTPVMVPLNPGWTGFIWFEELVVRQDPDFYTQLCRGDAKYTDETSVEAFRTIGELQKDGVFGDASVSFSQGLDQIPQALESGNYAMTLLGSWISGVMNGADVDFSEYGWFELPAINPDAGNQLIVEPGPFVLHEGYGDGDALEAVADGLLSTEFRQAWMEELGNIPVNSEVDASFLAENMQSLGSAVSSGDYDLPLRYWENTSPEVAAPAASEMQRIFQEPDNAEGVAENVEQIRQDVYGDV